MRMCAVKCVQHVLGRCVHERHPTKPPVGFPASGRTARGSVGFDRRDFIRFHGFRYRSGVDGRRPVFSSVFTDTFFAESVISFLHLVNRRYGGVNADS